MFNWLSISKGKFVELTFNNETILNCIKYDDNGKCIDYKNGCNIKNGQCICNSRLITIVIILSVLIIMIIITFILVYIKKRNYIRQLQEIENQFNNAKTFWKTINYKKSIK